MKIILVFILSVCFSAPFQVTAESQLKLTFLDVGEGDSILIESEGHRALIDTGNLSTGPGIIQKLKKAGIEDIDSVILTHPHLDHIGGIFAILALMPVLSIYDNGEDLRLGKQRDDSYRWYAETVRSNQKYKALRRGDVISLGRANLQVLWPPSQLSSSDWNINSLVIMLQFGKFSALLMGDGNMETERALLTSGSALKAQLLKAGHHGAGDTGSAEFIKAVSAEQVVVSINRGNIRYFSASETLDRYREAGAKISSTSDTGDLTILASQNGSFLLP